MLSRILSTVLVTGALLAGAQSTYATAVTNGGFESGDLTGWTLTGDTSFTAVDTGAPHDGSYAFYSGSASGATLSQTLSTIAGERYQLSFWLQNEVDVNNTSAPNAFSVLVDGMQLLLLSDAMGFGYTQYVLDFSATGTETSLAFTFQHGPAFWDLDDVTSATVPEPTTVLLIGLAGASAWMNSRRRRHAAQERR